MYINALITLIYILIHVCIVRYVHKEGEEFYSNRLDNKKTTPKVYDIGMKYIPNLSKYKFLEYVSHFIAFVLPICFGLDIFKQYLSYYIIVMLIRYVFICLTILPKDKQCDSTSLGFYHYITGHCYDKIFSGHFSSTFLLSLILLDNGFNIYYLYGLNIANAFLILSLRFHYTIDIVVGALVTLLVYQNKLRLKL